MAERVQALGVVLPFRDHARCGVPMTLLSLLAAVAWPWAAGILPAA